MNEYEMLMPSINARLLFDDIEIESNVTALAGTPSVDATVAIRAALKLGLLA